MKPAGREHAGTKPARRTDTGTDGRGGGDGGGRRDGGVRARRRARPAGPEVVRGSGHRRRGTSAWAVWATIGLALGAGLAGCGTDGRELREPSARQTTTSRSPSSATGEVESPAEPAMQLSSEAFVEGGGIPDRHTCRGEDESPALTWTGVPAETVELAVVVRDRDAGGAVHWVVAGLPPVFGGLAEGTVPEEAVEATNHSGEVGWSGPCPESGTHHYEFRLYALAEASEVSAGQPGAEAAQRVETLPALSSAALSGAAAAPAG